MKQLGFRSILSELLKPRQSIPTFREAWERYERGHLSTLRIGSQRAMRCRVKHWLEWHGDVQLDALTAHGQDYRVRRAAMPSARGSHVSAWEIDMEILAAGAVCHYAVRSGVIPESPLKGIKLSRQRSRKRERTYTDDELRAIIKANEWPPLTALILICRSGGCRPGEARQTRMSNVDRVSRMIHIPADLSKTHRARNVIVSQEAIDQIYSIGPARRTWVMENPESGEPWSITHIRRYWDIACDAAGITGPDRVLHAIRHTFCSTLFEYGATIPEAASAMGITLKQVETYAHPLRPMASVFEKAHRFGPKKVEDAERKSLTPKKRVG